jgi:hypothetical protein
MAGAFDRAFRRLARAFGRYQDVPREPERFEQISAARIELDDARSEMRSQGVRYRASPENDEFVEPGLGTDSNTMAGKVAAVAFVVVVAVGGVVLFRSVRGVVGDPLEFVPGSVTDELSETVDGRCVWSVSGDLRNTTDTDIEVWHASVATGDGTARFDGGRSIVPTGSSVPVEWAFVLDARPCPSSIDAVTPGRIRINGEFSIRP